MGVDAGTAAQPVRAANPTVKQAIEIARPFYLKMVIPLTLHKSMLPANYSMYPVSAGAPPTLPMTTGAAGMKVFL